jgi:murein DD-endopeptidase MepM/ murein hydrolase activator NlpD
MEKKYSNSKFAGFLKKNIYYILMVVCILAIGTMIIVAALNNRNTDVITSPIPTDSPVTSDPVSTDPVINDPDPIVFALPVADAEIGMDYSMEVLLYNTTLNQWQVHKGIDFKAAEGTDVVAAYDGVVTSITTDNLNGTVITILHADDMETIYASLDEDVEVILNQQVEKGDVIGKVSNSSLIEYAEGPHLHFELKVNGEYSDPNEYLPTEDK